MFNFFSKKNYLVDHLEGFVDIHNHILPGIDDGAKTVEDSISLIKGMGAFGITHFICTPHIMENYYPNNPKIINESLEKLTKSLSENNLGYVKIEAAAEHMIDAGFENILEQNKIMPLGKDYLLIEMSYLQASLNFNQALIKITENKYYPILAHPERYIYLHNNLKKLKELKDKGILFQLNFLSLSDFYGTAVQKMAFKLLEEKLIDFVASDVHNISQLKYLNKIKISSKHTDLLFPIIDRTIYSFYNT